MKKYYYLYQIRNKNNGMIYIGVHVTKRLKNKYMGSGTKIREAIKNEGIENFEKTILEFFDNHKKLLEREAEIVNEDFIAREDTYNIMLGGGLPGRWSRLYVPQERPYTLAADGVSNFIPVIQAPKRLVIGTTAV